MNREDLLWELFQNRLNLYASFTGCSSPNESVIHDTAIYIWRARQGYRERRKGSVSQKEYNQLLSSLQLIENHIEGGALEAEARQASKDAHEYLRLIVGYKVKVKNRVF